jgi:hypothetical protein
MTVTVSPTWLVPHSFVHIRAARERLPDPANVFGYGLLLPEVLRTVTLADPRTRMRVGVSWLGTLLDRDPLGLADPPPKGPVSRFFAERTIEAVFNPKRGGLLPKSILNALAAPAARVAQEDVSRAFGRFAYDIEQTSRTGTRPSMKLARDAALITGTHGPRIAFANYRDPKRGRTVYGFHAKTLFERLALEVQDLYLRRPMLRRCVFCDAVFVPRQNELNCRWALWDAETHRRLAECATEEMVDHWNATHAGTSRSDSERDRERERKRIDQRVHRALRRAGNNYHDPEVQNALAEREAFKDHFLKRRGPKGRPEAAAVDLVPTAAESETLPR